jgi:hypothetical protein
LGDVVIPRHRSFEEAVPAAPKEMVEKHVVSILVRFDSGGIDEVLSPADGDDYGFYEDEPRMLWMNVRGVRYVVNVRRACWWAIESKTLLVEKPPFKPAGA